MQKWEYKVVTKDIKGVLGKKVPSEEVEVVLKEVGSEGWELITVTPVTGGSYMTRSITLFFKKPSEG